MISNGRLRYRKRGAAPLELRIRETERADVIRSSDLAPYEVLGVVHHAHLIGFRVPHAELADVRGGHRSTRPNATARSRALGVRMAFGGTRSPFLANSATSRSVISFRLDPEGPRQPRIDAVSPVRTPAARASSPSRWSSVAWASPDRTSTS